jgi:hypothetical protein
MPNIWRKMGILTDVSHALQPPSLLVGVDIMEPTLPAYHMVLRLANRPPDFLEGFPERFHNILYHLKSRLLSKSTAMFP